MLEQAHTEKLIKETAKTVFFQKGFLKATTQEIADEAGVNRALIHYYFRSREQLLDTLLEEAVLEKRAKMRAIFTSDSPLRTKIWQYIDMIIDRGIDYPHLENFMISEMARRQDKMKLFCTQDRVKSDELIKKDLEEEIKKGKIAPVTAQHFIINMISMCNYPLLAKSILQTIHGMTDAAYKKFLLDRKQIIFNTLFNEVVPEENVVPTKK